MKKTNVVISAQIRGTIALMLGLALSAATACANTILFTTLPASTGSFAVVGPDNIFTTYNELAAQFVPTQSAVLANVVLPFRYSNGNNDALVVKLYTSINDLPGSLLGAAIVPSGSFPTTSEATLYTLSLGEIPLDAGTPYFLDASTSSSTWLNWFQSSTDVVVPVAQVSSVGDSFHSDGNLSLAFQVNGTAPEPGTTFLALSGCVILTALKCRRSPK